MRALFTLHDAAAWLPGSRLVGGLIDTQGLRDIRALVEVVGEERTELAHVGRAQLLQELFGNFVVGARHDLAGVGVNRAL